MKVPSSLALGFCSSWAALWACNQSAAVNTSYIPLTSGLIVSPSRFLGDVPCDEEPGAARLYRATILDVTDAAKPETLSSSELVACDRDVLFEGVTVGNRYIATVETFDKADLTLDGDRVTDLSGTEVAPTWTTRCEGEASSQDQGGAGGEGNDIGVYAYRESRVFVDGCAPMERTRPLDAPSARFAFAQVFPGVPCLTDPEGAASFQVETGPGAGGASGAPPMNLAGFGGTTGGVEPGVKEASCTEDILFDDLKASSDYSFFVKAFAPEPSDASWATSCTVRTILGLESVPTCEPFRTTSEK